MFQFENHIRKDFLFNINNLSILVVALSLLSILSLSCSSTKTSDSYQPVFTTSYISNLDEILDKSGAREFLNQGSNCQGLKIAVLDNGTSDLRSRLGRTLPDNVKTLNVDYSDNSQSDIHGVVLLEAIQAICSGSSVYDPKLPRAELHLYNTRGLKKLFEAVDQVIKNKIDIVVYAQTWEVGGNLDGTGFINKKINEAIDQGTIWFNAIGNYKDKTFYSKIIPSTHSSFRRPLKIKGEPVSLPNKNDSLEITVEDEITPVIIKLGWSDFSDDFEQGTNKDLDMYLVDSNSKLIALSDYHQQPNAKFDKGSKKTTRHPQEILNVPLRKGTYYLHIVMKDETKFQDKDYNMWVAISGEGRARFTHLDKQNNDLIFIPADNPKTTTVISTDCHCEPEESVQTHKDGSKINWDLQMISKIDFDNGSTYIGSSTATAIQAGVFALYTSMLKDKTDDQSLQDHLSSYILSSREK